MFGRAQPNDSGGMIVHTGQTEPEYRADLRYGCDRHCSKHWRTLTLLWKIHRIVQYQKAYRLNVHSSNDQ